MDREKDNRDDESASVALIVGHDWYWADGQDIDSAVLDAVRWYNDENGKSANFVQLCGEDMKALTLNGRLQGVTVFQSGSGGLPGNIMVGRVER